MSGPAPWKAEKLGYLEENGLSSTCVHEFVNKGPGYLDGVERTICVNCKGQRNVYPPGYGNPSRNAIPYKPKN
jgi:hypothetical protein